MRLRLAAHAIPVAVEPMRIWVGNGPHDLEPARAAISPQLMSADPIGVHSPGYEGSQFVG